MLDKGYDIEQENKPIEEHLAGYTDKNGEWHQQGLTPDQLKELSDRKINLRLEELKMSIVSLLRMTGLPFKHNHKRSLSKKWKYRKGKQK